MVWAFRRIHCSTAVTSDYRPVGLYCAPGYLSNKQAYVLGLAMQSEPTSSFYPSLCQRFQSLVWSCLDSDLTKSAVFHAERYFSLDRNNHESRHLYATALFREGQTYSALYLVNGAKDEQCTGCLEIRARCCTVLGRHRHAREALEATLRDTTYVASGP